VPRKKIFVFPARAYKERAQLFATIERLYPLEFLPSDNPVSGEFKAGIYFELLPHLAPFILASGLSSLVFQEVCNVPANDPLKSQIEFGKTKSIDRAFRGQKLIDEKVGTFKKLYLAEGDETLCRVDGQVYWKARLLGKTKLHTVAKPPLEIQSRETMYHHFNRANWVTLLPLLHFVKEICFEDAWSVPSLRACFMFDDPNLHACRYGHIDYRKLIVSAKTNNYHVSFATIPFDGWYTNSRAARLINENKPQISLVIHGNNHEANELAVSSSDGDSISLLSQALRRIEAFEKRSGATVGKVMVPPYGAFKADLAGPLITLGYEATCLSRSSLHAWNSRVAWPASFGHDMVEFIGAGFPIIPRHVIGKQHYSAYCLAAFLDQPIIPHGHHDDCADGIIGLEEIAQFINQLGQVEWTDVQSIARSNYLWRVQDDTLTVRMYSRRLALCTSGFRKINVERPWMNEGDTEPLTCLIGDRRIQVNDSLIDLSSTNADRVEIYAGHLRSEIQHPNPPFHKTLIQGSRRLLSEVRDRFMPLVS
jgi:hypothetical protein